MKYIQKIIQFCLSICVIFTLSGRNIKALDKQGVLDAILPELQKINYTDAEITNRLKPTRYSQTDQVNKRKEIAARKGVRFLDVTTEEVIIELNQENAAKLSYEHSFNRIKTNLETILKNILNYEHNNSTYTNRDKDLLVQSILNNKGAFLMALTYIDRFYNFEVDGNKILSDILMYEPNLFGENPSSFDFLLRLGNMPSDNFIHFRTVHVFNQYIKNTITSLDLVSFLEANLTEVVDKNAWYKNTSKAIIVEKKSNEKPDIDVSLYSKLTKDSNPNGSLKYLLPFLTIPENSLYIITNSATITIGNIDTYVDKSLKGTATYQEKLLMFQEKLNLAAESQKEFIDFWYRVAKPEQHANLNTNRLVKDTYILYGENRDWSAQYGENAASGVEHFFTPFRMYTSKQFYDAQADGDGYSHSLAKALDSNGLSAYTHELTHLLEKTVWFNNQGRRDGFKAEFYARGLYESYELNEAVFNLNLIYDRNDLNYYQNQNPRRFQTETDLKQYAEGMFDVLYTLDYAEANSVLKRSVDDRVKLLKVVEQEQNLVPNVSGDTVLPPNSLDHFKEITNQQAQQLQTIDDFIDQNIVSSRLEYKGRERYGKTVQNDYLVVPLFSSIYGSAMSETGVSGDFMSRRVAFELLESYGYYDGMVPYISNQYKNESSSLLTDRFIAEKILKGEHQNSFFELKKNRFKKRIDKINRLKEINITLDGQTIHIDSFEKIAELMDAAITKDLANPQNFRDDYFRSLPHTTQVEKLKSAIYLAYKNSTNDFRTTIYFDELMKDINEATTSLKTFERLAEIEAERMIDNIQELPENTVFTWINKVVNDVAGTFDGEILIRYPDNSSEIIVVHYRIKSDTETNTANFQNVSTILNREVDPKIAVTNFNTLPQGTIVTFENPVDVSTVGEREVKVIVTYPDDTKDEQVIRVIVGHSQADDYNPSSSKKEVVKNTILNPSDVIDNFQDLPVDTRFIWKQEIDTSTSGEKTAIIEVIYSDGSKEDVEIFVKVKTDAETYVVYTKDVIVKKGEDYQTSQSILNEMDLPINTLIELESDLDTSKIGRNIVVLRITFPDGTILREDVVVVVEEDLATQDAVSTNPPTVVLPIFDISTIEVNQSSQDPPTINLPIYHLENSEDSTSQMAGAIEMKKSLPNTGYVHHDVFAIIFIALAYIFKTKVDNQKI